LSSHIVYSSAFAYQSLIKKLKRKHINIINNEIKEQR